MISVEANEYNTDGFANLDEAVALAKSQGIANARGAVNRDVLWPLLSLGSMVGLGFTNEVPGIKEVTEYNGIAVYRVAFSQTLPVLKDLLTNTEVQVLTAAGSDLPDWRPTHSLTGIRMVTMNDGAIFHEHTDDYEGLVASVQLGVSGTKTMHAQVNHAWEDAAIETGDITLFAGDTFSEKSRILHGFDFVGAYAVAFTLGQDPLYTISGKLPLLEANPEYMVDVFRIHQQAKLDDIEN